MTFQAVELCNIKTGCAHTNTKTNTQIHDDDSKEDDDDISSWRIMQHKDRLCVHM